MSPAAPQNRAPAPTHEDDMVFDHAQGVPAQAQNNQNGAGAAQNDRQHSLDARHQAGQDPIWPQPGDPDYEQYMQDQHRQERGPRQKKLIRFGHWIGQRVVGIAAYLEGANDEEVAQRQQAYWDSREAARVEADNRRGFMNRAFRRLAGRAIDARDGAGRRWDYLMHGPGEGRANGPWYLGDVTPSAEAAPRSRTQPRDEQREPVVEPRRQPTRIRDIDGRDPRSPIRPHAQRRAGRDARRSQRGDPDHRPGNDRRDQERQPARIDTSDPAVAYAMHEYHRLPRDEQEANDAMQWVAARAQVLPNTEWGRVAVARMKQYLSGTPEEQHVAEAWDQLMAEPYLLPAGTAPEAWVASRSRLNLANAMRARDEALAGDEHLAAVRADLQRERELRAARQRAEQERENKVAASTARLGNIIHARLRTANTEFDPGIDGNRILRAERRAKWVLKEVAKDAERHNIPNPFTDPNYSPSQNAADFIRALDALTYAIVETRILTKDVSPTLEEAEINSEALIRAAKREVFGY